MNDGMGKIIVQEYIWTSLVAFCAAFVRAARWYEPQGPGPWWQRIQWWAVLVEIPTAIVLGVMAVGIGAYYKIDPPIVGAIAGGLGLVGPTALRLLLLERIGEKK